MTAKYKVGDKVLILNSGTDTTVNHFLKVGTIAEVTGQDYGDYWYIRGEDEEREEEISQLLHENSFRLINESDQKQEEQTEQPEGFTITFTKDELVYLYASTGQDCLYSFKNINAVGEHYKLTKKLQELPDSEIIDVLDSTFAKILDQVDRIKNEKEFVYDVLTEDEYGGRVLQRSVCEGLYNNPDWQSSYKILWSEKKEV